jgi:transposase
VGIEGTGTYGAGLCRFLMAQGVRVIEVDRPNRRTRRQQGKSDPIDAEAAARSVLAGTATTEPKARAGAVETIRSLRVARRGAVKARTAAINALRSMVVSAPTELRSTLERLSAAELVRTCARFRPNHLALADSLVGTKLAMRQVARRIEFLEEEIAASDASLAQLVEEAAPRTLSLFGVGVEHAGQFLVTAGDRPERLRSEASFAHLCGASPIPASSGRTQRHRLHRGGDRMANRSLHMAVVVRMRHCPRTRAYVARRTADGLSKKEIIRCLKRYLAREVFRAVSADLKALHGLDNL